MKFQHNDGGRTEAGFRGETGDCVTRSIAIATGIPYREVYNSLNAIAAATPRRGATKKRAAKVKTQASSRTGHHRKVYEPYLASLGWVWTPTMSIGSGCSVHLCAEELPAGRIICKVSRHLVAVIDGVIHDTHDCGRGGGRCVYGYFHKP
jgi:hypothetical protein